MPWRFSAAGRRSAWLDRHHRRPKTCTIAAIRELRQWLPCGLRTGRQCAVSIRTRRVRGLHFTFSSYSPIFYLRSTSQPPALRNLNLRPGSIDDASARLRQSSSRPSSAKQPAAMVDAKPHGCALLTLIRMGRPDGLFCPLSVTSNCSPWHSGGSVTIWQFSSR